MRCSGGIHAFMSDHLYLYLLLVGILTALTPWAIVGVIVLLGSRVGVRAALAFVAGWFCAVAFITALVAAGVGGTSKQPTTVVLIGEVVVGLLLIAFALRKRLRERSLPQAKAEPGWLRKLDTMRPVVAFGFGTFMINVVFVVDAGVQIAAADLATSEVVLAILFYTVLSTAGVASVLAVYFSNRSRAEVRLAAMRAWVARNNANVIVGMIAVVGVVLVLKGAIGLIV
jgi:threonine/homoserine/homoserine lactone efflux protein